MVTKVLSVALTLVLVASVVMVVTAAETPNLEGVSSHREEEGAVQAPTPDLVNTATSNQKLDKLTSATPLKGAQKWRPCMAPCTWLTMSRTMRRCSDLRQQQRSLSTN